MHLDEGRRERGEGGGMAGGVGRAGAGTHRPVPRTPAERSRQVGRLIAASLFALNVGVIVTWGSLTPGVRESLDPLYSWLCHRQPGRCYELGGGPMPVCARCLGVWLGLAVMALFALAWSPWRMRTGLFLLGWMLVSWLL